MVTLFKVNVVGTSTVKVVPPLPPQLNLSGLNVTVPLLCVNVPRCIAYRGTLMLHTWLYNRTMLALAPKIRNTIINLALHDNDLGVDQTA